LAEKTKKQILEEKLNSGSDWASLGADPEPTAKPKVEQKSDDASQDASNGSEMKSESSKHDSNVNVPADSIDASDGENEPNNEVAVADDNSVSDKSEVQVTKRGSISSLFDQKKPARVSKTDYYDQDVLNMLEHLIKQMGDSKYGRSELINNALRQFFQDNGLWDEKIANKPRKDAKKR